jgi:phosphocarrier protein
MLAAGQGSQVKLTCKGEQAEACLAEIADLIAKRFGEAQ